MELLFRLSADVQPKLAHGYFDNQAVSYTEDDMVPKPDSKQQAEARVESSRCSWSHEVSILA